MANILAVTDYIVLKTCITRDNPFISDQYLPLSVAQFCGWAESQWRATLTLSDGSVPRAAVLVYWAPLGLEKSC